VRTFPRGERGDRTVFTHPLSLVLIAFVVTAIPAFLLSKLIGKNLENLHVMALALLIGGVVMWVVDSLFVRPRVQQMEETSLPTAIWIGALIVFLGGLTAGWPNPRTQGRMVSAGYAARQVAGLLVPMGFMKFSRNAEREADLLGMEYMYASGYDPGAFLEFFEKLDSRVKEKKSFLAKAFSTHPMTGDRIRDAQKTIDRYLPEREQYVVTTSEFEQVRARLMALESRRMVDVGASRPKLRTRSNGGSPEGGDGPVLRKPEKPNLRSQ